MTTLQIITADDLRPLAEKLDAIISHLSGEQKNEKKYLRSNEVRRLLGGISSGKLQELRNTGLPFTRVGGTILYSPTEIETWIKANQK